MKYYIVSENTPYGCDADGAMRVFTSLSNMYTYMSSVESCDRDASWIAVTDINVSNDSYCVMTIRKTKHIWHPYRHNWSLHPTKADAIMEMESWRDAIVAKVVIDHGPVNLSLVVGDGPYGLAGSHWPVVFRYAMPAFDYCSTLPGATVTTVKMILHGHIKSKTKLYCAMSSQPYGEHESDCLGRYQNVFETIEEADKVVATCRCGENSRVICASVDSTEIDQSYIDNMPPLSQLAHLLSSK